MYADVAGWQLNDHDGDDGEDGSDNDRDDEEDDGGDSERANTEGMLTMRGG